MVGDLSVVDHNFQVSALTTVTEVRLCHMLSQSGRKCRKPKMNPDWTVMSRTKKKWRNDGREIISEWTVVSHAKKKWVSVWLPMAAVLHDCTLVAGICWLIQIGSHYNLQVCCRMRYKGKITNQKLEA